MRLAGLRAATVGVKVLAMSGSINDLASYIIKEKERYDVAFAFALPALE
jgi:hypothetical protein